jgi:hypothetical protein
MTLQQKAMELNMKLQLNDFIQDVNNNNIYLLLCPRRLAARARRGERIQTLNGKDLMKRNVKREAKRLGLPSHLIDSAVEKIWYSRSSYLARRNFKNLAAKANKINQKRRYMVRVDNNDTIIRVTRFDNPLEKTNNQIVDEFYGGTSDFDNKDALNPLTSPDFGSFAGYF